MKINQYGLPLKLLTTQNHKKQLDLSKKALPWCLNKWPASRPVSLATWRWSTSKWPGLQPQHKSSISALQKCFLLQPQHSQLYKNASCCSRSTRSFAEMLPTAATALSAICNNIQIPKFRTDHFSSFVCSCVLHANAISRPRKRDPTLRGPVVNLIFNILFFSAVKMLPTAAAALSALQKCFPLQPQHYQLCRNSSHCSHGTFSYM